MQVVWGDELNDETKGQDVLGVRGLDQRLEAALVNGITTISLRGRYLTILPWLLGEFFDREVAMGATEFSFDRLFNFIARVEYLTLASTQLDPDGGDGVGALGANIFNLEMTELRAGATVPFPADRKGTMLGIYVGPCRAMGILANSDGTSPQPVVLTPRGVAIWQARNAAMEGTGLRDLLWTAETLTPDQAQTAAPHFSLRSLHRSGQEAALLRTALLECWAPPESGSVVEDAYDKFTATVNWLLEEHSQGALHAETLLAGNYRRVCQADGPVDPVRVAWAEYEWRRRLHYGLELMASAFSETVLALEQAAPEEVIQAWAEEDDLPSQLTVAWPTCGSVWDVSGGEAVASVPADLFLGEALPVQNLSAMSPHSRALCAFGLLAALAVQSAGLRANGAFVDRQEAGEAALSVIVSAADEPFAQTLRSLAGVCATAHLATTFRKMAGGQKCSLRFYPEGQRLRATGLSLGAGRSNTRLINVIRILTDSGVTGVAQAA